jgi:AraC-like DNA-binding protein
MQAATGGSRGRQDAGPAIKLAGASNLHAPFRGGNGQIPDRVLSGSAHCAGSRTARGWQPAHKAIADSLGYADVSAFARAFRRSNGTLPVKIPQTDSGRIIGQGPVTNLPRWGFGKLIAACRQSAGRGFLITRARAEHDDDGLRPLYMRQIPWERLCVPNPRSGRKAHCRACGVKLTSDRHRPNAASGRETSPVGCPDFKSGGRRAASSVGSTPASSAILSQASPGGTANMLKDFCRSFREQ